MRKKCPLCGRSRGTQYPGQKGPFQKIPCETCKRELAKPAPTYHGSASDREMDLRAAREGFNPGW